MRFSKKIIITMFITVFLFIITMIVTYWFKDGVPDTLIEQFFSFFGVEGGALAIIKVGETIAEGFDKKSNRKKKKDT